jgi:hypothetical protein
MANVVPFFEERPLRTAKQSDFVLFAAVLRSMEQAAHRTPEGLAAIARVTEQKSPAAVSIPGILRGHTPATSTDIEVKIWS